MKNKKIADKTNTLLQCNAELARSPGYACLSISLFRLFERFSSCVCVCVCPKIAIYPSLYQSHSNQTKNCILYFLEYFSVSWSWKSTGVVSNIIFRVLFVSFSYSGTCSYCFLIFVHFRYFIYDVTGFTEKTFF